MRRLARVFIRLGLSDIKSDINQSTDVAAAAASSPSYFSFLFLFLINATQRRPCILVDLMKFRN